MDHNTIDLIQMLITVAIIPAGIFAFQLKASIERMNELMLSGQETAKEAHAEIIARVTKIESKIEQYEHENEEDHKQIYSLINDIDKRNSVDHAIFANGHLVQH